MKPLIGCIIQARLGSKRLSAKILRDLNGKTVLEHVLRRVQKSTMIDCIVLAIPSGEKIPDYGFDVFEGDERDVLGRYFKCAEENNFDVIVRITSDCPVISAFEIDRVINAYIKGYVENDVEYVTNRPAMPDGFDVEVFSFKALSEAYICATSAEEREHVTSYIKNKDSIGKIYLDSPKLSLDDETDLERIGQWITLTGLS